MVAISATAGVGYGHANSAAPSSTQTLPTADALILAFAVQAPGDTITFTVAGASPTESYQGNTSITPFVGVFVGAPSGSQTIAFSGGDSTDDWSVGFRGVDSIDTTDPFDNNVTDATPTDESIDITTTSDGIALGVGGFTTAASPTSADTELVEGASTGGGAGTWLNAGYAAGTGGTVTINWSAGNSVGIIGVNLRNAPVTGQPRMKRGGGVQGMVPGNAIRYPNLGPFTRWAPETRRAA